MGVIGQLPQSPDALPGREIGTGEPPEPGEPAGARAHEIPTLGGGVSLSVGAVPPAGGSRSISVPRPPERESGSTSESGSGEDGGAATPH